MKWEEIEIRWLEFKGDMKERWGRLTDDDLDVIKGRKDKLVAELQRKYSIAKGEAEREIAEFLEKMRLKLKEEEQEHQEVS